MATAPKIEAWRVEQEKDIVAKLHLPASEIDLQEQALLSKYIEDIDIAIFNEPILLFEGQITKEPLPNVLVHALEELLEQCDEIYEMCVAMAPCWCFDRIAAFFADLSKTIYLGDSVTNERFVILMRLATQAQENMDMCALSDLFYGEVPSVIRAYIQLLENQHAHMLSPKDKAAKPAKEKATTKAAKTKTSKAKA